MKQFLQNLLVRALCTLLVGILLIVFNADIARWIVILSGIVFIIPGAGALVSYLRRDPENRQIMLYPILGAGSILFGLVQIIWPTLFLAAIMYILAGLLLVMAATQMYTLWDIQRKGVRLHPSYYIVPVIQLAVGLYIILADSYEEAAKVAGLPVILLGCGFIAYALLELWTIYMLRSSSKDIVPMP